MSQSSSALEWVGVITGSGVVGSVLTKILGRKRDHAEAVKAISEAAVTLVQPLDNRISELTTRVATLEYAKQKSESKLTVALNHISTLYSWISLHMPNHTPPPPPEELEL